MMLASLETQSGLAPGSHRTGVTNRCAALATAVGVVAGVHDGTAAAGTDAHVALTASLAEVDVLVVDVRDLADNCGAVDRHIAHLTRGQTTTYGALAKQLAAKLGRPRMSAQAVGGAVGHNEISILIPCHRVVGANGSLTGYAGGIDKKVKLLELERANLRGLFVPKRGTAL